MRDRHEKLDLTMPPVHQAWEQPSQRSFVACKDGPCDGGKKPCPSPEACLRAERVERHSVAQKILVPLLLVALVVIVAALMVLR